VYVYLWPYSYVTSSRSPNVGNLLEDSMTSAHTYITSTNASFVNMGVEWNDGREGNNFFCHTRGNEMIESRQEQEAVCLGCSMFNKKKVELVETFLRKMGKRNQS